MTKLTQTEIKRPMILSIEKSLKVHYPNLKKRGETFYWESDGFTVGVRLRFWKFSRDISKLVCPAMVFEDKAITAIMSEILQRKFSVLQLPTYEMRLHCYAVQYFSFEDKKSKNEYERARWIYAYGLDNHDEKSTEMADMIYTLLPKFLEEYAIPRSTEEWEMQPVNDNRYLYIKDLCYEYVYGSHDKLRALLEERKSWKSAEIIAAQDYFQKKLA